MKVKKLFSAFLVLAMILSMLPGFAEPAQAASNPSIYTFDVSEGNIVISDGAGGMYDRNIKVTYGGSQTTADFDPGQHTVIITGSSTVHNVIVDTYNSDTYPKTVNITLDNVNIGLDTYTDADTDPDVIQCAAFAVKGHSQVNLTLMGNSVLKGQYICPGLLSLLGTKLTIGGNGTLTSTGAPGGAGIGSNDWGASGDITIVGGTVTAIGGAGAAGIGSGGPHGQATTGPITISGGSVTAIGGKGAAGIGSGGGENIVAGNVTISDNARVIAVSNGSQAIKTSGGSSLESGSTAQMLAANFASVQSAGTETVVYQKSTPSAAISYAPQADYQSIAFTVQGISTYQLKTGGTLQMYGDGGTTDFAITNAGLTSFDNVANAPTYWIDGGNYDTTLYDTMTAPNFKDTTDKNIEISTPQELAALARAQDIGGVDFSGFTFELTQSIDLKSHLWDPIGLAEGDTLHGEIDGSGYAPFRGNFDGGGYTVSNMKIEGGHAAAGLFGNVGQVVSGEETSNERDYTIANVTVSGTIAVTGASMVGGIVGCGNALTVKNCVNQTTITGSSDASALVCGGIIGEGLTILLDGCSNEAAVNVLWTSESENTQLAISGGIAGTVCYGNIYNCANMASITVSTSTGQTIGAGGIAAMPVASVVDNCYNTGAVTANGTASISGGICGIDAYTTYLGDLTAQDPALAIQNCYNAGLVSASLMVGGIAGRFDASLKNDFYRNGTADYDYYDSGMNPVSPTDGERLSDGQMQSATFLQALNAWVASPTPTSSGGNLSSADFLSWVQRSDANNGYPIFNTSEDSYTVSVSPAGKTFAIATAGYGEQTAQEFTIENTGTGTITSLSAALGSDSDFEISAALSATSFTSGDTATLSVRPKIGLSVGTHTGMLTVTGSNGVLLQVNLSFAVNAAPTSTVPTVTTGAASSVTSSGVTLYGDVTNDGGAAVTERGFVYGTSADPAIGGSGVTKVSSGSGTGTFTANISGLTAGTIYHVRSYATSSESTVYGADMTFTTEAVPTSTVPTVVTGAVSDVTSSGATLYGDVTNDGGAAVTERGFVYGTSADPAIGATSVTKVSSGSGTGTFTANISGLTAGTIYHVRSYAANSEGTVYGTDITFGTAAATSQIISNPKTGVTNGGNPFGYLWPLSISGAALAGSSVYRRQKKKAMANRH